MFIFMFFIGVIVTDLVHYIWHRFVEHGNLLGQNIRKYHLRHHHHYPATDFMPKGLNGYRISHPLDRYVLVSILIFLAIVLFPFHNAVAIILGGVFWGVASVLFHRTFHTHEHWLSRFKWHRQLTDVHFGHHVKRCNYGVIVFWFDRLFGTFEEATYKEEEKEIYISDSI